MKEYQASIVEKQQNGVPFTDIEDYINGLPLDDERKAALWIYAWSRRPSADAIREAEHYLTSVG